MGNCTNLTKYGICAVVVIGFVVTATSLVLALIPVTTVSPRDC